MWIEHPILQVVGGIVVVLLTIAWLFPQQRWLDPFRLRKRARPVEDRFHAAMARDSNASSNRPVRAPTAAGSVLEEARTARRERATRRFQRLEAGVTLITLGIAIPLGFAAVAMMTGHSAEAAASSLVATLLAGACFVSGALVLIIPGRR